MKTGEIAKKYGIKEDAFNLWLFQSGYKYTDSVFGGVRVDDSENIQEVVNSFRQQQQVEREKAEQIAREKADQARAAQQKQADKQAELASMLITSGFSFDGYTITKYSGYISGDDAVQISRGTDGFFSQATNAGSALMASLVVIRRNALAELKEAAHALGCNAVIGVDFDYLTLDPQTANSSGGTTYLPYVFGVTANGNAVVIQKNDHTGLR